ncbi:MULTISPECIES: TRIC cation channel family protein [unclassified Campylobacter]|uniref:trimeric intracellular cation channel family protein n=1 Tax=unclassified Campylobacter TaxID=2593542 RepID=UPI0014766F19|nr:MULTISPECIES: TRIC cation channel family protein [unclassified Campylobacter]
MDVFLIVEVVGIASAALSGFYFAIRKNCDWLGIFVAGFLTALGGGLMRDAIVSRPPYSFTNYLPGLIVVVILIAAALLKLHKREDLETKFLFITTDAFGIVSFSIVGAIVALEYNFNFFGVTMLALCNGVGGGILRDILLNEVPWFLKTGLYATVCLSVGTVYYFMDYFGFTNIYWVMLLFTFGVVFRLLAYYRGWHLPRLD